MSTPLRILDRTFFLCYASERVRSGAEMGDSYREAVRKNQERIQTAYAGEDHRQKAAKGAAIRRVNARKSRARYSPAHTRPVRLF